MNARRTLRALLPLLLCAGRAAGQEQTALCPYDATATGGAYYVLRVDGDSISAHVQLYAAIERAVRYDSEDPTRVTVVTLDLEVRVECPLSWVPQFGGGDPDPPPPPAAPDPDSLVGGLIVTQQGDGTWREIYTVERAPVYAATGVVPDRLVVDVGETVPVCHYVIEADGDIGPGVGTTWSSSEPAAATVSDTGGACPAWLSLVLARPVPGIG